MSTTPAPHFVVSRAGPMCASCAARVKERVEAGDLEGLMALASSLHVDCGVSARLTVTIERVEPPESVVLS